MLATLCYAARCRTSFNCSCYVLKGCAHDLLDAAILRVQGARLTPLGYSYTTYVVRMSNELGCEGLGMILRTVGVG